MLCYLGLIIANVLREKNGKRKRAKRTEWVKLWLSNRSQKGAYNNILAELRLQDAENYRRYLRMNTETFEVYFSLALRKSQDVSDT